MGYYEINIVSEQWKYWSVTTIATHKYCLDNLKKEAMDDIWHFISCDKLMAAKQKLSFCSCTHFVKGKPVRDQGYKSKIPTRSILKGYCRMFKPEFKYMQLVFTTPRDRGITVCITYRKES